MNYIFKYLLIDLALDLLDRTITRNLSVSPSIDPEIDSDDLEWSDEKEAELNAIRSSPAYQQMIEWYRRTTAVDRAVQD